MHLCFSCISYLSFGTEIVREAKTQPNNALDRFIDLYRLHRFYRAKTSEDSCDADENYWRECKIYRK